MPTDLTDLVARGGLHYDFETGSNGTPIESAVSDINGATDGTISTQYAATGTRSFQTFIDPGDGGYGSYGGILGERSQNPEVLQGGEVWVRWYSYHPSSWKNECDPYQKFMRVETKDSSGNNAGGYSDIYIDRSQDKLRWISETDDRWDNGRNPWIVTSEVIKKDVWQCFEYYTRLGATETALGGQGRVRLWVDGVLVFTDDDHNTLKDSGGYTGRILWRTWHQHNNGQGGGATERRYSYIDNWTIAYKGNLKGGGSIDCTPAMITDASGNYFIGTIDGETGPLPPPEPGDLVAPTNLRKTGGTDTTLDIAWDYTDIGEHTGFYYSIRESNGGSWVADIDIDKDARAGTNSGLAPDTSYDIRIRAYGGGVTSDWTQTDGLLTGAAPQGPEAPQNFTATTQSESSVQLDWDYFDAEPPPAAPDPVTGLSITNTTQTTQTLGWTHPGGVSGFTVEREISNQSGGYQPEASLDGSARDYTSTGLPSATLVRYRVRAFNADNASDWALVEGTTSSVQQPEPGGGTDLDALVAAGGYYENMSSVPLGDTPHAYTEWTNTTGTASSSQYHPDGIAKSLKTTIRAGTSGYGEFGFNIEDGGSIVKRVGEGAEVWFRVACYYEPGFNWSSTGGGLKFMRLWRNNSGGTSEGASEFKLYSSGQLVAINERTDPENPQFSGPMDGKGTYRWAETPGYIQRGRWHIVEMYQKFDRTPQPNAKGVARYYLDGKLIGKDVGQTMPANAVFSGIPHQIHTYWDGENAPQTQTAYFNHLTMAWRGDLYGGGSIDCTPAMATDEEGFPFLGTNLK